MRHAEAAGRGERIPGRWYLSVLLAAFALWLATHPLVAVHQHDARVYSILALHRLDAQAFARDPFFLFGSQDRFSIFSFLYAPLVRYCGLTVAAATVVIMGGLLWCLSAALLARRLLGVSLWWVFATLTLAIASINYSPNREVFWLNEHFATARVLAFPVGVMALALQLGQRTQPAWACATLSLLLHPLIGIWPLAVLLLCCLDRRDALLLTTVSVSLLVGLALWGHGPFAHFDPEWERILRGSTLDLFLDPPGEMRWRGHLLQLTAPLLAACVSRDRCAQGLYVRIVLVSAAGLQVAAAASYWWPAQLLVQAQLWRGMWLVAAILPVALVHIAATLHVNAEPYLGRDAAWFSAGLLIAAYVCAHVLAFVVAVALLSILSVRICAPGRNTLAPVWAWLAAHRGGMKGCVVLAALLVLPNFIGDLGLLEGSVPLAFPLPSPALSGLIWMGGLGVGTLLWALLLWRLRHLRWLPFVLVGLLFCLATRWDMRPASIRAWEARAAFGRQSGLAELIQPGEVVLWEGSMPFNAWFELRTAHYASEYQAVGMVFSRAKMSELLRRTELIRAAAASEQTVPVPRGFFDFSLPHGSGIVMLCQDRALDWLILSSRPNIKVKGHWVPPAGSFKGAYAIPCAQFRSTSE